MQPKRNILEQRRGRAEFAYQCAKRASENDYIKEEYKSLVKKLPMLIKNNGLGAALAFFFSKSKEGKKYHEIFTSSFKEKDNVKIYKFFQKISSEDVYKIIWECAEKEEVNQQNAYKVIINCIRKKMVSHYEVYRDISDWLEEKDGKKLDKELMESVIELDSPEYRATTIEILAFLNWLKRFADGLIQKEKTDGDE